MTREPTQDELQRLVDREVYYCISALVSTLAANYGNTPDPRCGIELPTTVKENMTALSGLTEIEDIWREIHKEDA
jgi:hypothetical protein